MLRVRCVFALALSGLLLTLPSCNKKSEPILEQTREAMPEAKSLDVKWASFTRILGHHKVAFDLPFAPNAEASIPQESANIPFSFPVDGLEAFQSKIGEEAIYTIFSLKEPTTEIEASKLVRAIFEGARNDKRAITRDYMQATLEVDHWNEVLIDMAYPNYYYRIQAMRKQERVYIITECITKDGKDRSILREFGKRVRELDVAESSNTSCSPLARGI